MLLTKHFILSNSQRKKEKRNIYKNGSTVIVTFSKKNRTTLVRNLKQHPDHIYLRTSFHRLQKEYKQLFKKTPYQYQTGLHI
jgi:hypothetical protein